MTPHVRAVLSALLVTALWSSSWVLIKTGLRDQATLPALPFAGLRYFLAFLCLLPFALGTPERRASLRALSPRQWGELVALGVVLIALAQGGQYGALARLPSATVSLVLNMTAPLVAVGSALFLGERPARQQWVGIAVALAGVLVYFGVSTGTAVPFPASQVVGLTVAAISLLSNSGGALLGRQVNRGTHLSPLLVTTVSMGIGGTILLGGGVLVQGVPAPNPSAWGIIGWLAVVNTAFAFTLWNYSLRVLTATESSLIASTMLVQICLLSWMILGETLTAQKVAGIVLTLIGVVLVQVRPRAAPR